MFNQGLGMSALAHVFNPGMSYIPTVGKDSKQFHFGNMPNWGQVSQNQGLPPMSLQNLTGQINTGAGPMMGSPYIQSIPQATQLPQQLPIQTPAQNYPVNQGQMTPNMATAQPQQLPTLIPQQNYTVDSGMMTPNAAPQPITATAPLQLPGLNYQVGAGMMTPNMGGIRALAM